MIDRRGGRGLRAVCAAAYAFVVFFFASHASDAGADTPSCAARFQVSADVVFDSATKLVWLRVPVAVTGHGVATTVCMMMGEANGTSWRLPSLAELSSIVDEQRSSPSLDPAFDPGTGDGITWSSTAFAGAITPAYWGVELGYDGSVRATDVAAPGFARCVR